MQRHPPRVGADDVGLDKGIRALDRAVHVRLGGKMHDGVEPLLAQQPLDEGRIADVALHEAVFRTLCGRGQIRDIAGIGQRVEHHHAIPRVPGQPVMHEIRADEAGAAGNEQSCHGPSAVQRVKRRGHGHVMHLQIIDFARRIIITQRGDCQRAVGLALARCFRPSPSTPRPLSDDVIVRHPHLGAPWVLDEGTSPNPWAPPSRHAAVEIR